MLSKYRHYIGLDLASLWLSLLAVRTGWVTVVIGAFSPLMTRYDLEHVVIEASSPSMTRYDLKHVVIEDFSPLMTR